jgi:glucose-6-phosphate isomerase
MEKPNNYFFENDLLRYESHLKGFTSSIFNELNSKFEELNVDSKIEDLFAGKNVNYTEDQAALHPQYRANTPNWPSKDLSEILNKGVLDGVLNIVVLGIGGSFEGPKLLIESLIGPNTNLNHLFITGSDPIEFIEKTSNLKNTETLFIISSKSFTTDETLETLNDAIKWSGDMNKFIAITANESEASKYNIKHIIKFDKEIGGRYSIWSDIAVPAFLDATLEPDNFLKGGNQADLDLQNNKKYLEFVKTLSYSDIWLNNSGNKTSRAVLSYSWKLRSFADYVQQLEMESLGKQPHKNSDFKKTGQIIFGGYGPTAQHSYFQLLHQGTQDICADIIASKEDLKSLAYAQAITQAKILSDGADDLLKAEEKINGNIPLNLFLLNKIDAFTLGYLIATWEHRTYITAAMLQINPYDQYGVSAGKIYTKKYLQDNGA